MLITNEELHLIASRCEGLQSIAHLYEEVCARRPTCNAAEAKELFLCCIHTLMQQGRLRFLGEGWVRDGVDENSPLMFGDEPFGPCDVVVNGLRQPTDPSPDGVVQMIDAKWPSETVPAFNTKEQGFDPVWFEKWYFVWCDETGRTVTF